LATKKRGSGRPAIGRSGGAALGAAPGLGGGDVEGDGPGDDEPETSWWSAPSAKRLTTPEKEDPETDGVRDIHGNDHTIGEKGARCESASAMFDVQLGWESVLHCPALATMAAGRWAGSAAAHAQYACNISLRDRERGIGKADKWNPASCKARVRRIKMARRGSAAVDGGRASRAGVGVDG
jgi:hypothetical protein